MVTIKLLELEKGTVKVGQTRSYLIDGLETTRLCEIRFSGKVFSGLLGFGVVVRKFNKEIILKDDEHHVNIDLDKVD